MEEIFAILKGPLDVDIIISLIYVHIFKVFLFLVLCYVLYFVKRPRGLPPGPYGYPIIGSLPDMSQDLSTGFSRIGRKYGSVFTVWMGSDRYWVVLNDYEAIKEAYVTRGAEFSDRDPDTDSEDTIFNAHYDEIYKESRKITAQAVRTFIKDRLDSKLQAEMTKLHTYMADHRMTGQPIDLKPHITRVFGNVIFNIVFNIEFKHGDPEADQLFTTLRNWFVGGFELEVLESLPLGSGHLYGMRKQTIEYDRLQTHLETVVERFINQHKATFKQSDVRDVLDAYLKVEGLERFGKRKVINTLLTLLPDSTATSVFTCQFLFLYLLNFPKYQDAILAEINCVKGDGMISILDRPSMPITESFIMEVLRKANPASVGIPTKPSKQTQLRGHTIPAHVDIFPNYKGVHYDPKIFPEPDAFKPERFLKDGKVENIQGFIPFGMGRRMCIGEHLVRNNLFLFLTNMIQKYQIKAGPSGVPSLQKDESSVVGQPYDFELVLDYRN